MADLQARVTELEAKLLASTTNEKALQARVAELEAMLLAATGPAAASATVVSPPSDVPARRSMSKDALRRSFDVFDSNRDGKFLRRSCARSSRARAVPKR